MKKNIKTTTSFALLFLMLFLNGCTKSYTVDFMSEEGFVIESISISDGSSILDPETPLKEGYEFLGWRTESPYGGMYDLSQSVTEDLTLYAKWRVNSYILEFVDVYYGKKVLWDYNVDFGTELHSGYRAENPIREGYTFDGWNRSLPETMPAENITIEAKYLVNKYELVFEDYDGTILSKTLLDYGTKLNSTLFPVNPDRTGFTFEEWDVTLPETMPAEKILIQAQYSINQYKLIYEDHDGTALKTVFYDYNSELDTLLEPKEPMKFGDIFDEWNYQNMLIMPAHDVVVKAIYLQEKVIHQYENDVFMTSQNLIITSELIISQSILSDSNTRCIAIYDKTSGELLRTIIPSNSHDGDQFAKDFEIFGDYLIVKNYSSNIVLRSFYVYKLSDDSYERIISLSDPSHYHYYERMEIISGDFIFASTNSGEVFVYQVSEPSFDRMLVPSDGDSSVDFGTSLVISGDYIFVSSSFSNNYYGAVYVYKISDSTYERKITTSGTYYQNFGTRINVQNDYIIIGNPNDKNGVGAIYVFKISDETYERKILSVDGIEGDRFGESIYIYDDYILAKTRYYSDNILRIYIYRLSDETYERKIANPIPDVDCGYGRVILVEGDYILVSALEYENTGAIFVYKFSDLDQELIFTPSNSETDPQFISSFLVEGDFIFISSFNQNDLQGSVYVYNFNDNNYERKILPSLDNTPDNFGMGIYIDGSEIYITDYNNIYIYDYVKYTD